jgi:hypothetical protein
LREELWLRAELRLRIELLQFVQQLLPSLLLEQSLRSRPRHVMLPQQLRLLRSELWLRAELRLRIEPLRLWLRQVSLLCRVCRPAHISTVRRTSAQSKNKTTPATTAGAVFFVGGGEVEPFACLGFVGLTVSRVLVDRSRRSIKQGNARKS